MPRRFSGRYDAGAFAAFCVDDGQKDAVRHADHNVSDLIARIACIRKSEGKRVVEDSASSFEADPVFGEIALRFIVVPFELIIPHEIMAAISFSTDRRQVAVSATGGRDRQAHPCLTFR
jgi:hypothetical protein